MQDKLLKNRLFICSVGSILASLPMLSVPAFAQAEGAGADIRATDIGNEIVVTAQKRKERLQDVPISISAVTGAEVAKRGLTNLRDLSQAALGLQATSPYANSNTKFAIRGVGATDFAQNYQSPIGIYSDEVFLGSPIDSSFAMFDIDHAEVLRGPQGTLFGKNTTGGAISLTSALPKDHVEGYVTVRGGNFGYIEPQAAISLPVTESLAVRFAGVLRDRDGTLKNLADHTRLNDVGQQAARFSALYKPGSDFEALLTLGYGRNDSNGMFGQPHDRLGQNPYEGYYNGFGLERIDTGNATLKLTRDFGGFNLTSITAYRANKLHRKEEPDSGVGTSGDFQVDWRSKYHQTSQELRLASDSDGRLTWMIGGYYYQDHLRANNSAQYPDPSDYFALNFRLHQDLRDFAAFGQATYKLLPKLNLTMGGRFTTERQKFTYENRFTGMDNPFADGVAPALSYAENRTYNAWSGKVGLEYMATRDNLIYASVSRGFNSGGHAGLAFSAAQLASTDPEYLIAYEVGTKNSFLDGALTLNLSGFYYDYKDIIVTTVVDTGGATLASLKTNAARAHSKGFELETVVRPVRDLSLTAGAAYLDARYTRFVSAVLGGDFTGNRLPSSPKWTLTGAFNYDLRLPGDKTLSFNADVQHVAPFYRDAQNTPQLRLPSRTIANARITLQLENGLSLGLWSRNLFDEHYFTDAFTDPSIADVTGGAPYGYFYGDPRTYGFEVGIRF